MQEDLRDCGCNNCCNQGNVFSNLFGGCCDNTILFFIIVFLLLFTNFGCCNR